MAKYLDTNTVKTIKNVYNTNFPYDVILTKADASTSDSQVKKLNREFNINYRACIGPLIYFLSTRLDLIFHYTS